MKRSEHSFHCCELGCKAGWRLTGLEPRQNDVFNFLPIRCSCGNCFLTGIASKSLVARIDIPWRMPRSSSICPEQSGGAIVHHHDQALFSRSIHPATSAGVMYTGKPPLLSASWSDVRATVLTLQTVVYLTCSCRLESHRKLSVKLIPVGSISNGNRCRGRLMQRGIYRREHPGGRLPS